MSVSWGTQYAKLKTNLRLASNRLKLLQKKKTEQAQKARIEIADFLSTNKEDRARIRVESIIREDFVVEAYELLEMFCELLLARFGLIQQMKELDDGIAEAVSSILWVAPRISHEISEFKIINDQLTQKYGKQFAEAARMNQLPEPSRVAPKLIQKLSVSAPSKILVEKYLIEIARCANIDFTPDSKVMRDDDDEIAMAERNLMNFINEEQIGWTLQPANNAGLGAPGNNLGQTFSIPPGYGHPGDFPSKNNGKNDGSESGGNTTGHYPPPPQYAAPQPPSLAGNFSNFNVSATYPSPNQNVACNVPGHPSPSHKDIQTGYDIANKNSIGPPSTNNPFNVHSTSVPHVLDTDNDEHIYEVPPSNVFSMPNFPEPPSDFPVTNAFHSDVGRSAGGGHHKPDELNFDELTKRFEELKKKL